MDQVRLQILEVQGDINLTSQTRASRYADTSHAA